MIPPNFLNIQANLSQQDPAFGGGTIEPPGHTQAQTLQKCLICHNHWHHWCTGYGVHRLLNCYIDIVDMMHLIFYFSCDVYIFLQICDHSYYVVTKAFRP